MKTVTKWNKTKLIDQIAQKADVPKTVGARVLDATMDAIIDALRTGNSVPLVGFGTFSVKDRAARKGRNPRTGVEIHIPATKVPTFKAGKKFKETVQ